MTGKRDQYYLHLNCNDSSKFYPSNKPADFRINLPKPLSLDGYWECALVNISFWPEFESSVKPKEMYICSDIVGNSYALQNLYPVLKRVSLQENLITKVNTNYSHVDFVPVTHSVLQSVRIYIIDNAGLTPSFLIKDLYCSLLLRRKIERDQQNDK
jgi:hypothetical protein